jgi:hypothetical protein
MPPRLTALLGVIGAASLGVWLRSRRRRKSPSYPECELDESLPLTIAGNSQGLLPFNIDDDRAAEIIRRARPALEKAREVQ